MSQWQQQRSKHTSQLQVAGKFLVQNAWPAGTICSTSFLEKALRNNTSITENVCLCSGEAKAKQLIELAKGVGAVAKFAIVILDGEDVGKGLVEGPAPACSCSDVARGARR